MRSISSALAFQGAGPLRTRHVDRADLQSMPLRFGVASSEVDDHHRHAQKLFLKKRYPKRAFQYGLKPRMRVLHRLEILTPFQKGIHHFAHNRTWPDTRHLYHDVIEASRRIA